MYCGVDLPQPIGDIVASKIQLINQYGASELGICALLQPKDYDRNDWKYVQFHPDDGMNFVRQLTIHVNFTWYTTKRLKLNSLHSRASQVRQSTPLGASLYAIPKSQICGGKIESSFRHDFNISIFTNYSLHMCSSWKARADDIIVFWMEKRQTPSPWNITSRSCRNFEGGRTSTKIKA